MALTNRNYLFLMLALFALSLMLGVRGALNAYMTVYYWELTADQFANILLIGSAVGYVSGFLLSARIHGRFDKRATIVDDGTDAVHIPGHAGDPAARSATSRTTERLR